jgi:serine/threonine protein kinase
MPRMLSSGKQLGPYEIIALIGAGGMGEVYRARDTRLQRTVALKVLPPEVAADAARRQRFEHEARAASALNHPNILTVYDTGEQDGLAYIVSELIEGESLRDMLKRGPLPQSRVVDLGGQVADALAAAHAADIVHRDLKPENIMVTRDGRAKVLDFGLAKQIDPAPKSPDETAFLTRTSPGTVLGTAGYMSPEQVRIDKLDGRSDIFSLGVVLHECLSGRNPFERKTSVEAMTAILREDPPELPENVPAVLRQILGHCLEKEPERRFHSARDLAFALRTVSTATRSSGSAARIVVEPRRRRWLWPAIAGILGVLLATQAIPHLLELEPINLADYKFTPFATEPEAEHSGVWSPDGKSIAYLKSVNGIPQLMVRALDASAPIQLTKSEHTIRHLFWAPDASLLYYLSQAGRGELWGVSPAGGHPTRILEDVSTAAVSPDGKTIAFWRITMNGDKPSGAVWLSSPPGAAPRPYKPAPFSVDRAFDYNRLYFAPDGSSILLLISFSGSQLWRLPFPEDHGQPQRLFADTDLGLQPTATWLPDSRHAVLAFAPGLSVQSSLWLADLKRERMRKLTAGTSSHGHPSISPDGRRIVFTSTEEDYDLMQLPVDGTAPRTLVANSRNELSPSWSAQGDQIIYSTDRTGTREIWIRNLKAGLDRPVMTADSFPSGGTIGLVDPVFSPDGTRFAFARYATKEEVNVWVAPTVGGSPIRLTSEYMQSPTWSPDGNSVAGLMQKERPWQPAIVGVGADMAPHLIPGAPSCQTPPDWSPTGNWIACESEKGVSLFNPDGSQHKLLPRLNSTALAFSRDGKIIYAAGKEHGRAFLKSVDVATGTVRQLADYGYALSISGGVPFHTRLSLAPDGKSLATSAVATKSDLWLVEGFPQPRPWWKLWGR